MLKNKNDFLKFFLAYTGVFIIPVLLICFAVVSFLFTQLAISTKQSNLNILEQAKNLIDSNMRNVITLSYQMSNSQKINNMLQERHENDSAKNFNAWKIAQEISLYQTSGTLFSKLSVYSKVNDIIIEKSSAYSMEEYFQLYIGGSEEQLSQFRTHIQDNKSGFFVLPSDQEGVKMQPVYYRPIKTVGDVTTGTLLVMLDPLAIQTSLQQVGLNEAYQMLIMDYENNILFSNGEQRPKLDNDGMPIVPHGYTLFEKESAVLNVRYVYICPKGALYGKVRFFALAVVSLFLAALGLSALFAKKQADRMNGFVFSIMDENEQLREGLDLQLEDSREKLLINLLQNHHGRDVDECIQQLQFTLPYMAVMTLGQGGFEETSMQLYTEASDEALKRMNTITCEIFETLHIPFYSVRYDAFGYVYVLNFDDYEFLRVCAEKILKTFLQYKVLLHIGVGEPVTDILQLHTSYNGAVSAFRYSLLRGYNAVVYYVDIKEREEVHYYYTSEREMTLIRYIKQGQSDKVITILEEIYDTNFISRQISYTMLQRLIYNMVLTMYRVLDEIYPKDAQKQEHGERMCKNILQNDNVEECFNMLREAMISVCDDVDKRDNLQKREADVVDYISRYYTDKNLSLNMLADVMQMNYYTLSRMFKECIGTSFVGYLTSVRLESAKLLLVETDKKIEQIAEETGFYSSGTFIKAFKKYYNETPGAYRKRQREDV